MAVPGIKACDFCNEVVQTLSNQYLFITSDVLVGCKHLCPPSDICHINIFVSTPNYQFEIIISNQYKISLVFSRGTGTADEYKFNDKDVAIIINTIGTLYRSLTKWCSNRALYFPGVYIGSQCMLDSVIGVDDVYQYAIDFDTDIIFYNNELKQIWKDYLRCFRI